METVMAYEYVAELFKGQLHERFPWLPLEHDGWLLEPQQAAMYLIGYHHKPWGGIRFFDDGATIGLFQTGLAHFRYADPDFNRKLEAKILRGICVGLKRDPHGFRVPCHPLVTARQALAQVKRRLKELEG